VSAAVVGLGGRSESWQVVVTGFLVIVEALIAWALLISFFSFHQGHLYYWLLHHWWRGEGPQDQNQEPGQVSLRALSCQSQLWCV
jgi:hypothetical protein